MAIFKVTWQDPDLTGGTISTRVMSDYDYTKEEIQDRLENLKENQFRVLDEGGAVAFMGYCDTWASTAPIDVVGECFGWDQIQYRRSRKSRIWEDA